MPKVLKEDLDQLNASLTVVIEKESYSSRFESALKNYKHKSHLKGFRKGKAPEGFLKKAYGPAILADLVNDMLQEELNKFLTQDRDTNYLGHPLPSPEQAKVSFDPSEAGDYEFKFDIGKAPEFEIKGLGPETVIERFTAAISDEELEKDLEGVRRRMGKLDEVEDGTIEDEDLLNLHIHELENGEHLEGGIHHHFVLRLDSDIADEFKAEIKTKKIGEKFTFNPFAINKEASTGFVRRYYLGLEEEPGREIGTAFEGRIDRVRRAELPPVDQAFFDSYFGEGAVTSVEEAKERIGQELSQYFNRRAEGLFYRSLRQRILDLNREQLDLPHDFLKRWLEATDENNTPEQIEKSYDSFSDSLRWSLIRNKIIRERELQITEAEVRDAFASRILESVGYQLGEEVIQGTIDRLMNDEKQVEKVADEVLENKIFQTIASSVTIEEKPLSFKELSEKEMAVYEPQG